MLPRPTPARLRVDGLPFLETCCPRARGPWVQCSAETSRGQPGSGWRRPGRLLEVRRGRELLLAEGHPAWSARQAGLPASARRAPCSWPGLREGAAAVLKLKRTVSPSLAFSHPAEPSRSTRSAATLRAWGVLGHQLVSDEREGQALPQGPKHILHQCLW